MYLRPLYTWRAAGVVIIETALFIIPDCALSHLIFRLSGLLALFAFTVFIFFHSLCIPFSLVLFENLSFSQHLVPLN